MKVSEKDVLYVADLANLELTSEERNRLLRDLNSILDYVDRLNQLDTRDVPPRTLGAQVSDRYAVPEKTGTAKFAPNLRGAMREDTLSPSLSHEAALGNAPETDGAFFKVPKVIER